MMQSFVRFMQLISSSVGDGFICEERRNGGILMVNAGGMNIEGRGVT